ncbi:MAG: nucleotidyltransferase family protein [Acidobacteriota bacterium]|nr:nucleotidyltransferase family protein [Acidobacteriota bacterium]
MEELKKDSSNGEQEIAAFAISTQGLSALVAKCVGIGELPDCLSEFLITENLSSGARARRLRGTWEGTVRTLRAAGVEVIALKGAALAFFHYTDPALRPMGDLDLLLVDPRDLARATDALNGAGWRALLDTPRHRVFAREDERVVRPAAEDPDNPIRIEIHTTFRLAVLGYVYDADEVLRAHAEKRDLDGTPVAIAAGPAFLTHLLFHATGDFAGIGIRGVQAYDFRLLARARGALSPEISANGRGNAGAPLLFAADAIERLFPLTFKEEFLSSLSSSVPSCLRRRAAALPALRYTRPPRGWSRTLLTLIDRPLPKARFVVRTVFPTLGEVKANAAPGESGLALAAAWVRVLARRVGSALRVRA